MKRILVLLLVATMLLLGACAPTTDGPKDTVASQQQQGNGEEEVIDYATIPEDAYYDGVDFVVYCTGNLVWHDFEVSENDKTMMGEAIFKRNAATEQNLGVKIIEDDDYKWGDSYGSGQGYKRIMDSYTSATPVCDIAMVGTHDVASLGVSGAIRDLKAIEEIHLERPYWNQKANEAFLVGGKLPFTIGSFSTIVDSYTFCILFNKKIHEQRQLPDLYELVDQKKWTVDKFAEFCRDTYEDIDNNMVRDGKDVYGAIVWNDTLRGAITAAGERVGIINDQGNLELTFYNDRIVSIINKYTEIAYTDNCFNYHQFTNWGATIRAMFKEDRALFNLTAVQNSFSFRDADTPFGFLPYFMLDESQDSYYSMIQEGGTQFYCIPMYVEDFEKTCYVTEFMAAESYAVIRPAFYERSLVGKTLRDDESIVTLDIILGNQLFDMGAYYLVGNLAWDSFEFFELERTDFASWYNERLPQAEQDVAKVNAEIAKLK